MKNKQVYLLGWAFTILIWVLIYILHPMYIDYYNFQQLEKAKPILESISENEPNFYNLTDFKDRYNINIKPIKNCYYISNNNWNEKYIFWFKLESNYYKNKYNTEYYAYPKYDKPIFTNCLWWEGMHDEWHWWGWCFDASRVYFEKVISNPCEN